MKRSADDEDEQRSRPRIDESAMVQLAAPNITDPNSSDQSSNSAFLSPPSNNPTPSSTLEGTAQQPTPSTSTGSTDRNKQVGLKKDNLGGKDSSSQSATPSSDKHSDRQTSRRSDQSSSTSRDEENVTPTDTNSSIESVIGKIEFSFKNQTTPHSSSTPSEVVLDGQTQSLPQQRADTSHPHDEVVVMSNDANADANSSGESMNQRENVEQVNISSSPEDHEVHVLPPSLEVVSDRQNASPTADQSTRSNNENGNPAINVTRSNTSSQPLHANNLLANLAIVWPNDQENIGEMSKSEKEAALGPLLSFSKMIGQFEGASPELTETVTSRIGLFIAVAIHRIKDKKITNDELKKQMLTDFEQILASIDLNSFEITGEMQSSSGVSSRSGRSGRSGTSSGSGSRARTAHQDSFIKTCEILAIVFQENHFLALLMENAIQMFMTQIETRLKRRISTVAHSITQD